MRAAAGCSPSPDHLNQTRIVEPPEEHPFRRDSGTYTLGQISSVIFRLDIAALILSISNIYSAGHFLSLTSRHLLGILQAYVTIFYF